MNKTIIIEGPDGMGKSTLAKTLSEHYGMELCICGPAPKTLENILYWTKRQEDAVIAGGKVLDRVTAFSHQVYKRVLETGPEKNLYLDFLTEKAKALVSYNPIIIYCSTSEVNHVTKDYDDEVYVENVLKNIPELRLEYIRAFATADVNPIRYDWTKPNAFNKLLENINAIAR